MSRVLRSFKFTRIITIMNDIDALTQSLSQFQIEDGRKTPILEDNGDGADDFMQIINTNKTHKPSLNPKFMRYKVLLFSFLQQMKDSMIIDEDRKSTRLNSSH